MGVDLWQKEKGKKAKFYTDSRDSLDYGSDDEYIDEDAEEVSLSTITDADIRQRINHKLNTSITTFNEDKSDASLNLDLFPLEKIIENEKEFILWGKVRLILVMMGVIFLSMICLGTKDIKSALGLSHCSPTYLSLFLAYIFF